VEGTVQKEHSVQGLRWGGGGAPTSNRERTDYFRGTTWGWLFTKRKKKHGKKGDTRSANGNKINLGNTIQRRNGLPDAGGKESVGERW